MKPEIVTKSRRSEVLSRLRVFVEGGAGFQGYDFCGEAAKIPSWEQGCYVLRSERWLSRLCVSRLKGVRERRPYRNQANGMAWTLLVSIQRDFALLRWLTHGVDLAACRLDQRDQRGFQNLTALPWEG